MLYRSLDTGPNIQPSLVEFLAQVNRQPLTRCFHECVQVAAVCKLGWHMCVATTGKPVFAFWFHQYFTLSLQQAGVAQSPQRLATG